MIRPQDGDEPIVWDAFNVRGEAVGIGIGGEAFGIGGEEFGIGGEAARLEGEAVGIDIGEVGIGIAGGAEVKPAKTEAREAQFGMTNKNI